MIDKVTKVATGQDAPDPVARLAIIALPFAVAIIGTLLLIMLSDIKGDIANNTTGLSGTKDLLTTMQQGFAVQQEILETINDIDTDQEQRIRGLERWQTFVNNQPGSNP